MSTRIADVTTLGAAIRTRRRERGWTQAELAQAANVSRRFVGELEAGDRAGAELSRVFAVLRALGASLALVDVPESNFDAALMEVLR
jgi:y4mF family transcriptional regulator